MRTRLMYGTVQDEVYDAFNDKMKKVIRSRGFDFMVSDSKSEEEHYKVLNSFESFMKDNNVRCDGFGSGTWEEAVRDGDTSNFAYLSIGISEASKKQEIEDLYKEWKVAIKPTL